MALVEAWPRSDLPLRACASSFMASKNASNATKFCSALWVSAWRAGRGGGRVQLASSGAHLLECVGEGRVVHARKGSNKVCNDLSPHSVANNVNAHSLVSGFDDPGALGGNKLDGRLEQLWQAAKGSAAPVVDLTLVDRWSSVKGGEGHTWQLTNATPTCVNLFSTNGRTMAAATASSAAPAEVPPANGVCVSECGAIENNTAHRTSVVTYHSRTEPGP